MRFHIQSIRNLDQNIEGRVLLAALDFAQKLVIDSRCGTERLRFHRVTVDDLSSSAQVLELGRKLRLGPPRVLSALDFRMRSRRHRNERSTKKLDRNLSPAVLDELEEEVRDRTKPWN